MRLKLNRLFELRAATVELKKKLAEIRQAGNELFDQFQDEFKASLEVKKTRRPAKKKLKPAPAGN
jgi:septation ring formation regulator EzrA